MQTLESFKIVEGIQSLKYTRTVHLTPNFFEVTLPGHMIALSVGYDSMSPLYVSTFEDVVCLAFEGISNARVSIVHSASEVISMKVASDYLNASIENDYIAHHVDDPTDYDMLPY